MKVIITIPAMSEPTDITRFVAKRSVYSMTDRSINIILDAPDEDGPIELIAIHERRAEEPVLRYSVSVCERSRTEFLRALDAVRATVDQLPEDGTLDSLARDMGTSFEALAI